MNICLFVLIGNLRCYNYPLNGEYDEYGCTSTQITRIRISSDDNFLFITDDNGCLIIYELKERNDRFQRTNNAIPRDLLILDNWTDDILITRIELEDKLIIINELLIKVDELKLHNEYQLKLKEMYYIEKIKEITDKYIHELEQMKTNYELLKEEKNDNEMEYYEKIKQNEEEHQYCIQELETNFQAQIMELVDSYQQLMRDRLVYLTLV